MMLATPKIVVLDSATIGEVARDYWAPRSSFRNRARSFLARQQDLGVFVTFSLTHIIELCRHGNEQVVQDRLKFLSRIPLIAWLRPYHRTWFPGALPDLLRRELHAVVHGSARSWREIVDQVRPDLWETGEGSEIFAMSDEDVSRLMSESNRQHDNEKHVASVARTDPTADDHTHYNAKALRPEYERHEGPSARTGPDGHFRLDRPYRSRSYLRAHAKGFFPAVTEVHEPGEFILITLGGEESLRVRVVDVRARPVAEATVRLVTASGRSMTRHVLAEEKTDTAGLAHLPRQVV